MLKSFSAKTLAGPGYVILNCLRVMNIIALALIAVANMGLLVETIIATSFFFFDGLSHIITFGVALFLIVSEIGLFRGYFSRNWPMLSPERHGFVFLGLCMLVLGIDTLGNLNNPATSAKHIGEAFWRIMMGAGILVIIFGFLNILASYVFRSAKLGVTARQVRAKGAVSMAAEPVEDGWVPTLSKATPHMTGASSASMVRSMSDAYAKEAKSSAAPVAPPMPPAPLQQQQDQYAPTGPGPVTPPSSGRREKRGSGIRFPQFNRRSALPPYHLSTDSERGGADGSPTSRYSERPGGYGGMGPPLGASAGAGTSMGMGMGMGVGMGLQGGDANISGPLEVNPQFAHLVRPDRAWHPANRL